MNKNIGNEYDKIRFLSLYHWSIYADSQNKDSFVSSANILAKNCRSIKEFYVLPHYMRSAEKTYSVYHSPLIPKYSERNDDLNGENKYTSDGRLIYDMNNGFIDVSYSAAFELGRLLTLSDRAAAEKITAWRKEEAVKTHINALTETIGTKLTDLTNLCEKLTEGADT